MQPGHTLKPGAFYPLGSNWDGNGVNFALMAPHAQSVTLCLFDETGRHEVERLSMPAQNDGVWHGYLEGAAPGLVYGYRVSGVYSPRHGHRFNFSKVLLDPYAREVVGTYDGQDEFRDDVPYDTAAMALKGKVVHEPYDWGGDRPPDIPSSETVIYEAHVRGLTRLHPDVPDELRGTYAGLAYPSVLAHLKKLGVTAVSLLPVHFRADEARLQKAGLSNYWGYSSIGFFAPEIRYWSRRKGTTPISEFRDMVKGLHAQGIEVLLDVVYNHTAETDEHGPTLSFRGIGNALYYQLKKDDPAQYENWSGCGNCLNLDEPGVLRLVMDSLRYWVTEMHVDGFRFDLATTLTRGRDDALGGSPFLAAIMQDPVLARVKQIAEPWDLGQDGYWLGGFPPSWLEWNDRYRDTMRSFWLHQWPTLGEFARRFAASSDLFDHDGRVPAASVNFIAVHDGFTLQDLVSYNHKHNHANGEENRDGSEHNHSWNCGVEGFTASPEIRELRDRLKRSLLATLFFSQGTPMLMAGDETGHTQKGNNNAYCQDNETTWIDWQQADAVLIGYVAKLTGLRRRFPALRRADWFRGVESSQGDKDIRWLAPEGGDITGERWNDKSSFCMGMLIRGGKQDRTCLLLMNASAQDVPFSLPEGRWQVLLDSAEPDVRQPVIEGQAMLTGRTLRLAVIDADW